MFLIGKGANHFSVAKKFLLGAFLMRGLTVFVSKIRMSIFTLSVYMLHVVACGGTYSLSSGNSRMIASPGFGAGNYPAYSDCQWNFLASSSTILVIAINEIKLQDWDTSCRFDYVRIYKGVYSAKVRQHKLCSTPNMYLLNGNATITFQSNGNSQGSGFRIDVVAVKGLYAAIDLRDSAIFLL